MDREELLSSYCKAIIAGLTGVESQKRKAKFIYDLNRVRDWRAVVAISD